ncbi:hypothetical protein MMC07_009541 [Pseudocyphellaria aurata]|nr:hypothetical protein [Pseudocyphellaria aurata]
MSSNSGTQEGPTESPPSLPEGWLAQWESSRRKYYYVQRATGVSQWEIPTQPALSAPTPDPTPQQASDPFQRPPDGSAATPGANDNGTARSQNGVDPEYQGADRNLLSDLAINAVTGKQSKPQKQSGLGGLASSFLGGQGSHGSSGQGGGGLAGQFVGSLLGGGKPSKPHQSDHQSSSSGGYGGSSAGHGQSGLMGIASSLLGGQHGASVLWKDSLLFALLTAQQAQSQNYGYTSSGQGSGGSGYTGTAPSATYQPSTAHGSNKYDSSGSHYNPSGQTSHQNASSHTPGYGDSSYGQSGHGPGLSGAHDYQSPQVGYGQQNQPYSPQPGGQHNPAYPGPPSGQYGSSPSAPGYGQQNPSYPAHPQDSNYNAFPGQGQQHQYPQHNPSYPSQPGGYDPYNSPPPVPSHPGQQSGVPGSYPSPPDSNYGHGYQGQGGQGYGQQGHQGGYGPQGAPYGGSGAPPAPGWRA